MVVIKNIKYLQADDISQPQQSSMINKALKFGSWFIFILLMVI